MAACTVQVNNSGADGKGTPPTPAPPPTWNNLRLGGRLLLIEYGTGTQGVRIIQMALDGSGLTYLSPRTLGGTVVWLP